MKQKYEVFISYRREGGGESLACLISERLKKDGISVFLDMESLGSGKYNERLYSVIEECTTVLLVLPEHSLDRCIDEEDWVRREVTHSIEHRKKIIPIMMKNFEWPDNLPEEMQELPNYNGVNAIMEYFDAAYEKILSFINEETANKHRKGTVKNEVLKIKLIYGFVVIAYLLYRLLIYQYIEDFEIPMPWMAIGSFLGHATIPQMLCIGFLVTAFFQTLISDAKGKKEKFLSRENLIILPVVLPWAVRFADYGLLHLLIETTEDNASIISFRESVIGPLVRLSKLMTFNKSLIYLVIVAFISYFYDEYRKRK